MYWRDVDCGQKESKAGSAKCTHISGTYTNIDTLRGARRGSVKVCGRDGGARLRLTHTLNANSSTHTHMCRTSVVLKCVCVCFLSRQNSREHIRTC